MLLKDRYKSRELMMMCILNTRMELSEKERYYYQNLQKGYDGEVKFDQITDHLKEDRYIINDLLLEVNNSYFQIDKLIISQDRILLLDIKNFDGDFYLDSDRLYSVKTGRECKNPNDQIKRSTTLFRQLLQNHKLNYLVEPSIIFINPEFTLYQAPMDSPFILPTQVKRFLNNLNGTRSNLNDGHRKLAQKLISLHQTHNPYTQLPHYNYDQVLKGNYCNKCKSFHVTMKKRKFVCQKCDTQENVHDAILRNVEEFKLLFPERKITTQSIDEWCKVDLSQKTIYRILNKHFSKLGNKRYSYYE